jgi:hypothetical protein
MVEFLVEFLLKIPIGVAESEIEQREDVETAAAAKLFDQVISSGSGECRPRRARTASSGCTAPPTSLSSMTFWLLFRCTNGWMSP